MLPQHHRDHNTIFFGIAGGGVYEGGKQSISNIPTGTIGFGEDHEKID
jgi:hypothetical protein